MDVSICGAVMACFWSKMGSEAKTGLPSRPICVDSGAPPEGFVVLSGSLEWVMQSHVIFWGLLSPAELLAGGPLAVQAALLAAALLDSFPVLWPLVGSDSRTHTSHFLGGLPQDPLVS